LWETPNASEKKKQVRGWEIVDAQKVGTPHAVSGNAQKKKDGRKHQGNENGKTKTKTKRSKKRFEPVWFDY